MSKSAAGSGTIRKKTVTRNGKSYEYWEGRYTVGYDSGTGRQIQRSISGKTQKEVARKLKAATAEIDAGTYTEPCRMNLGEWLTVWEADYLGAVKPYTVASYSAIIKNHIRPALGAVRLDQLDAGTVQRFYNGLDLSPKTVKNVHGVLHRALSQAVRLGYIRFNPVEACILPRVEKKEIQPLDEAQTRLFLDAIKGHRYEDLFIVVLFTGLREGEALGLMWDCIDFQRGTILIDKQLQREKKKGGTWIFAPLKNDRARVITPAPFVMDLLKAHRARQQTQERRALDLWEDTGLVFTNELGGHLSTVTVYNDFKKVVKALGLPAVRFHDLRHSYAVAAIRAGDDIKTVQGNLGHATASFTLDVYGHVTDQMRQASAARMNEYISGILQNRERGV